MQSLDFNTPRKRSHFAILLSLAKADGSVSPEEVQYLKMYGALAGVSEAEVLELIDNVEAKDLMPLIMVAAVEKEKCSLDLMVLAMADGEIRDSETKKIYEIATTISVSSVTVDKLFRVIQMNSAKVKALLETFSQQELLEK